MKYRKLKTIDGRTILEVYPQTSKEIKRVENDKRIDKTISFGDARKASRHLIIKKK